MLPIHLSKIHIFLCPIVFFLILSCQSETSYFPKPKGYHKIILPQKLYQKLPDTYPYFFEYSQHAQVLPDSSSIAEPFWIHIYYPQFEADVQITYKPIRQSDSLLFGYLYDSYRLTSKHNIKAYAIEESIRELPNGNFASTTVLEGEVPSQFQFHVSDSLNHFLRGALYFNTATKNDSLQPVIQYIKGDIIHMLNTLKWNQNDSR